MKKVVVRSRISGNDLLRLKGIVQGKPLIGPRSVNIHITSACNLGCRFCWYHSPYIKERTKRVDLDHGVLRAVLDDCAAMKVETIDLEGGEVVQYPHIAEVFHQVTRLGMGLSVYTNLAFGSQPVKYLCRADQLRVNCSATNARSYRKVHGVDRFDDVIQNIQLLRTLRDRHKHPKLLLTFVVNELNYSEIPAALELADRLGVDGIFFKLLEATVELKSLMFTLASMDQLRKVVDVAQRSGCRVDHNLLEIDRIIMKMDFLKRRRSLSKTRWHNDRTFYWSSAEKENSPCYAGWFFGFIDERGRVIAPCDNVGVCVAGNVYKRSFKDIWFDSVQFRKVRQEALCGISSAKGRWIECRYCSHTSFNDKIRDIFQSKFGL